MLIAVGNYTAMGGPGLCLLRLMGDQMEILSHYDGVANPIWVAQGKKNGLLYAAAAGPDGRACAAAYRLCENGPVPVSLQQDDGAEKCHLCLDEEEKYLYTANYDDGSVAVFPLDENGLILPCIQYFQRTAPLGPNPARQEHTHAHQVIFRPGTKELFLCDLGADCVAVYEAAEDGKLTEKETVSCLPGTGPRHLAFDGADAFYLVGELEGWVSRYERKEDEWQCVQHLSTLPLGYSGPENTAAAIRQDEGHVYVSNRGHDSIAVFRKLSGGRLDRPYFIRTPGVCPRDFLPMNGGFLLAHQQSGTVTLINENGVPVSQVRIPGAVSVLTVKPG